MVAAVVSLAFLVPATAACLYYLVPMLIPLRSQRKLADRESHSLRFAILIPAHDEKTTLPRALRSICSLDYPANCIRVHVVADNCTDATAAIARSAGVDCLERTDTERRGKGYALAFGLEAIAKDRPDIVLVLDADCELNPAALREMAAGFAAGAEVVQSAVRFGNADAGATSYVAAVGAALDDRVAAARDRLGRSVPLRGMGMAFRWSVLERVPWDAFGIVEDAEYDGRLRQAGLRIRFCRGAVVTTYAPANTVDLTRQRRRWRAALRPGRWFESKPLVLLHLAATIAVCLATRQFLAWALALLGATIAAYICAMLEVGLSWKRLGLLAGVGAVVLRLGWVALAGAVRSQPVEWNRTPRATV